MTTPDYTRFWIANDHGNYLLYCGGNGPTRYPDGRFSTNSGCFLIGAVVDKLYDGIKTIKDGTKREIKGFTVNFMPKKRVPQNGTTASSST